MMDILRDVAVVLGLIISLGTFITLITGSGKKIFWKLIKTGTKDIHESVSTTQDEVKQIGSAVQSIANRLTPLEDASRQRCRDQIKSVYYKYCDKKVIPLFERKTIDYNYQIYTEKFEGNSYITTLYEEMLKWEIDPHGFTE